jgi:hypothetical protein
MNVRMDPLLYAIVIYILVMFGGHFLVRIFLTAVRIHTSQDDPHKPLDVWIGCIERFVALTIVIVAPSATGPFVLAWVTAKIAANW